MNLSPTRLRLDAADAIARVDPRVFGGFLEHLGRAVYGGVFDPSSRHADAEGFRSDVLNALAALRFTAMRYPGGNFVSGYNWRDGVGRRELLSGPGAKAKNTFAEPNLVVASPFTALRTSITSAEATIPPLSLLAASIALSSPER